MCFLDVKPVGVVAKGQPPDHLWPVVKKGVKMKILRFLLILFVVMLLPSFALASTIEISSIPDYKVSGGDMDGMQVTVSYGDGSQDTEIWSDNDSTTTNPYDGGATGTAGWALSFDGEDTYSGTDSWLFSSGSTGISAITIDAFSGGVVFDILSIAYDANPDLTWPIDTAKDTPNSSWGYWQGNGTSGEDTFGYIKIEDNLWYKWEFLNEVAIIGDSDGANGDVFGALSITFLDGEDGAPTLFQNNSFEFLLDTDFAVVPEPSTMLLFGLGLLGIGAIGRKKMV